MSLPPWTMDGVCNVLIRSAASANTRAAPHLDNPSLRARCVVFAPTPESVQPVAGHAFGILLARPDHPLAQAEIIPGLNYLHHRSGSHVDFFCAGYGRCWPKGDSAPDDMPAVNERATADSPWLFSQNAFVAFVEALEAASTWTYGGGATLLMMAATVNVSSRDVNFDYSQLIEIDLDRALSDGAIVSVRHFFEDVIRAARKGTLSSISDTMGVRTFWRSFVNNVLARLPLDSGTVLKQAAWFAVRDCSLRR